METNKRVQIFKSPFLERLTLVHPAQPIIYWTLVFFVILTYLDSNINLLMAILGLCLWTLAEYFLHRYIFHFKSNNKYLARFVYIIHGNHHDIMDDKLRSLFPIFPASLIGLSILGICTLFVSINDSLSFMLGFIIGYLLYDYLHYSFHQSYFNFKIWKRIRNHHLRHHSIDTHNFGVSSSFWDYIFRSKK